MRIKIKFDASKAFQIFDKITKKISYATNNALTRVAKEMQAEGQKELVANFTVRSRFIVTRLQILQYSKRSNLTTVVGINADVQGSPLLLGFFEDGGTKESIYGDSMAIPITGSPARPNFSQAVVRSLRYENLNIANRKGSRRTYIVPNVGIFERVKKGNAPDATILIYAFEKSAQLKKQIGLIAVMQAVLNARFLTIWKEEFEKEVVRLKR